VAALEVMMSMPATINRHVPELDGCSRIPLSTQHLFRLRYVCEVTVNSICNYGERFVEKLLRFV
jgi:hypothetical protein